MSANIRRLYIWLKRNIDPRPDGVLPVQTLCCPIVARSHRAQRRTVLGAPNELSDDEKSGNKDWHQCWLTRIGALELVVGEVSNLTTF